MTVTHESVSRWLTQLQQGRRGDAAERIWSRYHGRLLEFAARLLPAAARRTEDEEDVVIQAFHSFFRRMGEGRLSELGDREDLCRVLLTITRCKAVNQLRRHRRQKRGGDAPLASEPQLPLEQLLDATPSPELLTITREWADQLLGKLDPTLQRIALLKLEGFTNLEIAARIGRSLPTVERRLRLIRRTWTEELSADERLEP